MKKQTVRMQPVLRAGLAAGLVLASATCSVMAADVDLNDSPLFSTSGVPGNLVMPLSVEWPTATSTGYIDSTSYSTSLTYLGYFDSEKCYDYNYNNATPEDSYFSPASVATGHVCTGKWSGNYLNWASMQTLDTFRWVLTGGSRSLDTATQTILRKTRNAHNTSASPDKIITSSMAGATPFSWPALATRTTLMAHAIVITGDSSKLGAALTNYYTGLAVNSSTAYRVYINVEVCKNATLKEANCVLYSGGNYKPEGLMQKYAMKLRYAVFGYYNHDGSSNDAQQRDGGVLRAKMKYIGPLKPVPGSAGVANTGAAEWDATTGVMLTNPDAADATATNTFAAAAGFPIAAITNSGAMNYINKFGILGGTYKSKDPVSELYYAAIRYLKNLGNVSNYSSLAGAGSSATAQTWVDGFPVIPTWTDPVLYSCQKNFALGLGDANSHRDANLPGAGNTLRTTSGTLETANAAPTDTTVDVVTATNMVGKLEGHTSLGTTYQHNGSTTCVTPASPSTSGYARCNTYFIAGLAYDAHTKDIRPDLSGTQTVNTYWVDVLENQKYTHKNQYWLAAKYGGFAVPAGFSPYAAANDTATVPLASWYSTADTMAGITTDTPTAFSTDVAGAPDKRPDNYFPGNSPDKMKAGLESAFSKIVSEADETVSTAFSLVSPRQSLTDNASFSTTYNPNNWTGELVASRVSYATDAAGVTTVNSQDVWNARDSLNQRTHTDRKIITCCSTSGLQGIAFTNAALNGTTFSRTNYASFAAVPGVAVAVGSSSSARSAYLNYLRGDRSLEVNTSSSSSASSASGVYRKRTHLMGDVVNSPTEVVGRPGYLYLDSSNKGYSTFKSTYATRKTVVYMGANDGMLHAFDGEIPTTGGSSSSASSSSASSCSSGGKCGYELFAYVPSFMYGDATTAPVSGLAALGAPTGFSHHYMVDGGIQTADVDFNRTNTDTDPTSADWRTVLVGTLGKGGKGIYALDVTDPSAWTSETVLAGKVLWEYTDSTMGYVYGTPSIVRTKKYGWTVIVTSGYNNADGYGYVYFINPKTGALYERVKTATGGTSAPINMSGQTAFVVDFYDGIADAVYAGDLSGNMWRVDVSSDAASYTIVRMGRFETTSTTGTVTSSSSSSSSSSVAAANGQGITTRPFVEVAPTSLKRYVLFGTGRLLADSDITRSQMQSFYAVLDGTQKFGAFEPDATYSSPLTRSDLQQNTDLTTGIGAAPVLTKGWYVDLTTTYIGSAAASSASSSTSSSSSSSSSSAASTYYAPRMVSNMAANYGVVVVPVDRPSGEVCTMNGESTALVMNFANGKSLLTSGTSTVVSTGWSTGMIANVAIIRVGGSGGGIKVQIGNKTGDKTLPPATLNTSTGVRKLNWREVPALD